MPRLRYTQASGSRKKSSRHSGKAAADHTYIAFDGFHIRHQCSISFLKILGT
jgi:hypothetical protein